MEEKKKKKLFSSFLVRIIGLLLAVYATLALLQVYFFLSSVKDQGTLGFTEEINTRDSIMIVTNLIEESPAEKKGLQNGDTITHLNGNRITIKNNTLDKLIGFPKIGNIVTIRVQKQNEIKDFEITIIPTPIKDQISELLFRIIPVILFIIYIIAGLWGTLKYPYNKETLIIGMFCFSFGTFMYIMFGFSLNIESIISRYLLFYEIKQRLMILALLAPSFWIFLFLTFPRPFKFYTNNKLLSIILLILFPIIVLTGSIFKPNYGIWLIFGAFSIGLALGVILLNFNLKRTQSQLERRQLKLIFLGVKYGSFSVLAGWIIFFFTISLFSHNRTLFDITIFLLLAGEVGGLIIPITFINSFAQNKLIETEGALKRRLRYIGSTTGLLIVYLTIIFFMGNASISIFNLKDPSYIIGFVLIISLTFAPLNKKLLAWIDYKFYPEKTKYANAFKEFVQKITLRLEEKDILEYLEYWLRDTININKIIPATIKNERNGSPFLKNEKDSIVNKIKDGSRFFWDELNASTMTTINNSELKWALKNDISVSFPMICQGEILGILNAGKKTGNEDFTKDDLDIMSQAANQTAIALQNINLQQHYIEKKRIDKELDMARRIQNQLMPQHLPEILNLDIAGKSKACFEVAGDYFDIIKMEDGNSVLVVADVSGKGAGAAIIMANLQASIRLGIHLSDMFNDFVTRINNLIYENTSPSEFITFFMGIWQPQSKKLVYVNAGHNPPILIDKDNNVTQLHATGLILGIMPDQKYDTGQIIIEKDSILVIYTDGLEEAMNPEYEIYGQERIIKSILMNKHLKSNDLINKLINEAEIFCEGELFHDDVTMIVAKGI